MPFTTAREILEGLSQIEPSKIQGVNGVMLFDFSGEGGGKWTLTLSEGQVTVEEGETATPNVTFSFSAIPQVASKLRLHPNKETG